MKETDVATVVKTDVKQKQTNLTALFKILRKQ